VSPDATGSWSCATAKWWRRPRPAYADRPQIPIPIVLAVGRCTEGTERRHTVLHVNIVMPAMVPCKCSSTSTSGCARGRSPCRPNPDRASPPCPGLTGLLPPIKATCIPEKVLPPALGIDPRICCSGADDLSDAHTPQSPGRVRTSWAGRGASDGPAWPSATSAFSAGKMIEWTSASRPIASELSGAQKQRICIARPLAVTAIGHLQEVTSALDQSSRGDPEASARLQKERKVSYLTSP